MHEILFGNWNLVLMFKMEISPNFAMNLVGEIFLGVWPKLRKLYERKGISFWKGEFWNLVEKGFWLLFLVFFFKKQSGFLGWAGIKNRIWKHHFEFFKLWRKTRFPLWFFFQFEMSFKSLLCCWKIFEMLFGISTKTHVNLFQHLQ